MDEVQRLDHKADDFLDGELSQIILFPRIEDIGGVAGPVGPPLEKPADCKGFFGDGVIQAVIRLAVNDDHRPIAAPDQLHCQALQPDAGLGAAGCPQDVDVLEQELFVQKNRKSAGMMESEQDCAAFVDVSAGLQTTEQDLKRCFVRFSFHSFKPFIKQGDGTKGNRIDDSQEEDHRKEHATSRLNRGKG